ncbi:MAG: PD-(D/E)XK nuclease family protein [Campylobacterales bacterium]|nr:PD-(D/E)XK nuclease family protein [Campylobacterales bacterium]
MCKLKDFINKNLPKVLEEQTIDSLGDRSKYIGASDIGGCLRKAYLSKISKVKHTTKQLIIFERGHLAEGIVAKMLKSRIFKLLPQVEVKDRAENGFPIEAHIDFVVDGKSNGKRTLIVIEAKSTDYEVTEPYDNWTWQTQLQLHLLQKKYPNVDVRGYVVAINVNTGWHETFEIKPNSMLRDISLQRANTLAEALVSKIEPEAEVQLYCSKCDFKANCPAVTKLTQNTLPEDVQKVVEYIAEKAYVEKEIKAAKKQLEEFFEATGMKYAKAGDKTVSYHTNSGKETIDIQLLKAMYPDIYEQVKCRDKGYSYIKVV